jgi:hypothetical protein
MTEMAALVAGPVIKTRATMRQQQFLLSAATALSTTASNASCRTLIIIIIARKPRQNVLATSLAQETAKATAILTAYACKILSIISVLKTSAVLLVM